MTLDEEYDSVTKEIADLERDLEEDEEAGWVLGDAHEALDRLRRRCAALERQIAAASRQ